MKATECIRARRSVRTFNGEPLTVDWDIRRIDMGIAMCHFALAAEECHIPISFRLDDPGLSVPANTVYIATCAVG